MKLFCPKCAYNVTLFQVNLDETHYSCKCKRFKLIIWGNELNKRTQKELLSKEMTEYGWVMK